MLLDNFEQVLDAATEVAGMLAVFPGPRALVTSRALLRVQGEHQYPVLPLAPPAGEDRDSVQRLGRNAAVRLFVEGARALLRESEAMSREQGDSQRLAWTLTGRGFVEARLNDAATALRCFREALALRRAQAHQPGIVVCLAGCADVAMQGGDAERAAVLLAAVEAYLERAGEQLEPPDRAACDAVAAAVRAVLDGDMLAAARTAGRQLDLDAAVSLALRD